MKINSALESYTVELGKLNVREFQSLRSTTDWANVSDKDVENALSQNLFSVSVYYKGSIVGMGRIIGDGSLYIYLQDIVVNSDHRGKGLGRLIMLHLETYIKDKFPENGFVGLMAAEGTESFYSQWGYEARRGVSPGMYRYGSCSHGKT